VPFLRGLIEGLGGESFAGHVEAFLLTLESGGSSGPHGMIHTGHELVFCMRGTLEYEVEEEHYLLEPGDSLIFASQLVHRWRNPGHSVANAIIVISAFEESERPGEFHLASMISNNLRRVELGEDDDNVNEDPEVGRTGDTEEFPDEEI
jgi:quercetin dioxygenase-like cupin family protein